MDHITRHYKRIWCVDFEYHSGLSGADAPIPVCFVAKEILSRKVVREWLWKRTTRCPIDFDEDSLFVAYYAAAEINCLIALGWPIPKRVLDLQVEFRAMLNGIDRLRSDAEKESLKRNERFSLLAALFTFGIFTETIVADHKDQMRDLAIRGGPYSDQERRALLAYNESDVLALEKLLPRMAPHIDLKSALFRGRYMCAVGAVERSGIPVDGDLVTQLKANWPQVVDRLIAGNRGGFDVIGRRDVDQGKLAVWLQKRGLLADWPRTTIGQLDTSSNTLSDWAKYVPEIMQLKEFLHAVRKTRLFETLQVGSDGRNRFLLSPFSSKTGRNQPSNAKSVFGPAAWVRSIIRPIEGHTLLYLDWSGQEYGEAAFFSGDELMIQDYVNDDPYLGFAKRIGLVPQNATKKTHSLIRNQLKIAAGLGVLYGAQAATVARAGNMTMSQAKTVLQRHRETYPTFWRWRQSVIDHANITGMLRTPLGWEWRVSDSDRSPSISNFMMQAAGADMLRVAMCLAVEQGIEVVAPVHDALLVQAPTHLATRIEAAALDCMREASRVVLGGPELKVGRDAPVVYPAHYSDGRGVEMWNTITSLLAEIEAGNPE